MGLTESFGVLATLPPDQALPYAEAALREPYPELQAAAFEALSDPAGLNRPDLVLPLYPTLGPDLRRRVAEQPARFLPAARALLSSERDAARRVGYEALAALDPGGAGAVLVKGLDDPSPLVRDAAVVLLESVAVRYYYHLVAARLQGDAESRAYVEAGRAGILALLDPAMRLYPRHRKKVFLDVALESYPETWPLLADLLRGGDPEAVRALLQALTTSATEAAVDLLFRLAGESDARLRDPALAVLRRRRDPGFPALVAAHLSRRLPDELSALATRTSDLPWWGAVEAAPALDAGTALRLMDFVARSAVPPRRKHEQLLVFQRSPYPEVRARLLDTLQLLEAPDLLSLAQAMLADPAGEVRLAAVRAVIALNPPHKTRLLLPLVDAEPPELGRLVMREVASASYDRIVRSFSKLDPATRETAARALAKIDGRILDRLAEEVGSSDPERRLTALRIVETLDAEAQLREVLTQLIIDPDRRVRATAVKVVRLAQSEEGMTHLLAALADPDRRVRANAVEAFEDGGDERCVPALLRLLEDPDNRVRANVGKSLCRFGRPEGRACLEAMLRDPQEAMRLSAAWAIGELGYPGSRALLTARALEDESAAVRARIAEALENLREAGA